MSLNNPLNESRMLWYKFLRFHGEEIHLDISETWRALKNHCDCTRGSVFEINMEVNGSLPVTQSSETEFCVICQILNLLLDTST